MKNISFSSSLLIMNVNRICIFIILIIPFSASFQKNRILHQLAQTIENMAVPSDSNRIFNCSNDTECLNSEKCIGKRCMDPCPGLCGIDAICKVIKHTMTCSCFKCYEGNPYIRCTPYLGLKRWMCKYFGI
ncbi:hypothetical protein PV328_005793 [Microctonus aethiopoides]|uniref:Uncharacterized protein n=1 Tax=Microctonus aethiopoides TaxID=144406 RepID=A0AA39KSZ0_9HYME|nr:hypothetical protein PV328_005793 [Microctonus aethiopoides]